MLDAQTVMSLLEPVSPEAPCGEDLEYDSAYTALETAARGKPEQQFGQTVIAAIEPEWPELSRQAQQLLSRTKDLRLAVLLTRCETHAQGIEGLLLGLKLIRELLQRYWPDLHPQLDADDGNDPTMRMNALAPLDDEALLLHDYYDAMVGQSRTCGVIRVRDIAIPQGAPGASAQPLAPAQLQGALAEITTARSTLAQTMMDLAPSVRALRSTLDELCVRADLLDLTRLEAISGQLALAAQPYATEDKSAQAQQSPSAANATGSLAPLTFEGASSSAALAPALGSSLRSRQDALVMIDSLIAYFELAEPSNPAPLLLRRVKSMVGVGFLDIISKLAPSALESIEAITGRAPES